MKKILCLIDGLNSGGAERQMVGLAMLLKSKGYDTDLAYYHKNGFYDYLASGKLCTIAIQTGNSRIGKLYHIYRFIRKGKYHVVITYKQGPNVIACLTKLLGAKFKLIVSDRNTSQAITLKEQLQYLLYRWAEYVVPNSDSQRSFISSHFPVLSSKTVTITNFTDTKCFRPLAKPKHGQPVRILTVARISRQKNVKNYLHAIKQVSDQRQDVVFDWYGEVQIGEMDYWDECCKMVDKLSIGYYINFYPATKDIINRYQECDVFCLPSLYEGYPNALCEAMSCGKPVLCSRVCDNPQIVNEGKNGIMFNPEDANDMGAAILRLLSLSEAERDVMGRLSRKLAEERFSEEVFVEKYIHLIES